MVVGTRFGNITGVMAGAGGDVLMRYAEPLAGILDRGDAALIEGDRLSVGDLLESERQANGPRLPRRRLGAGRRPWRLVFPPRDGACRL